MRTLLQLPARATMLAKRARVLPMMAMSRRALSTSVVEDDNEEPQPRLEPSQAPSFLSIGTRRIFNEDHDAFRATCRQFFAEECPPDKHTEWEKAQMVPRELWTKAGEVGLLGVNCPEEYGGLGADILYAAITWEEQCFAKGSPTGPGFPLHSDIVMPYILHHGTEAQKRKYLPAMCAGEIIAATPYPLLIFLAT